MKQALSSLFFVLIVFALVAQKQLSDKVFYGGGAGFSASSGQTNISVYPMVGYKVTPKLSAGVGLTYQYVSIKFSNGSKENLSNYGYSIFGRYNVTQQFFAHTEYERLSFEYFTNPSLEATDRLWYDSFLVGGGYSENLGGRASFMVTALYNLLYDESDINQPYSSPWVIRAGVGVGF